MRVTNQNNTNGASPSESTAARRAEQLAKTREKAKEGVEVTDEPVTNGSASAEISSKAREMAQAKEVAAAAPDVRESKIAELKRRIANKEYNVKPEDIADKLVKEHMHTRGIS